MADILLSCCEKARALLQSTGAHEDVHRNKSLILKFFAVSGHHPALQRLHSEVVARAVKEASNSFLPKQAGLEHHPRQHHCADVDRTFPGWIAQNRLPRFRLRLTTKALASLGG